MKEREIALILVLIVAVVLLVMMSAQLSGRETADEDEYCGSMSLNDAIQAALSSECGGQGTLKETHVCNEYTGTWWIDLDSNEEAPLCNPACVVDVETGEAEINWRCTGALVE